ncbi:conserved exported hypothetical protein [Candidatus Terasakiella magnetica]|nr:conserved exported hypothetical protein [Candidatus Terasakiella magnetica]
MGGRAHQAPGAAVLAVALLLAAPPAGAAVEEFSACADCPPMVVVPAGSFIMGDNKGHSAAERPTVSIRFPRPFALGRTEVTFDQWQLCVDAGACRGGQDDHEWGRGKRPVINVTWADARAYAAWIGKKSGLACRLPSESEWEYAARAGTTTGFWWGDTPGGDKANCRDCLGKEPPYGSKPVGSFAANPWGLYDMNGNVWEWVEDCWTPDHVTPAPADTATCGERVTKGGSWYYFSAMSRASARAKMDSRVWSYNIGIRVLCEIK